MAWDPGGFPHNWDPFFRGDVSWMGCPAGDQAGFQDIPRHIGDYSDGPELPGMALEDAMSYMPPMGWLIMVWENQCFAFLWTTLRFSKTMIHPMITWKIYENIRYLEFWYLEFWYQEFSWIFDDSMVWHHQRSPTVTKAAPDDDPVACCFWPHHLCSSASPWGTTDCQPLR